MTKRKMTSSVKNVMYVQHFIGKINHANIKHNYACCNMLQCTQPGSYFEENPPLRAYVSRAKCGILILIPVYAVVLSKVHWTSECCGNIVEVFLKFIKTLKAEDCLSV